MMNMKHTGKLVTAFALIALLTAPASARYDGDEGGVKRVSPLQRRARNWWSESRQPSDIFMQPAVPATLMSAPRRSAGRISGRPESASSTATGELTCRILLR